MNYKACRNAVVDEQMMMVLRHYLSYRPVTAAPLSKLKRELDRRWSPLKWRHLRSHSAVALTGDTKSKLKSLVSFGADSCEKLGLDPATIELAIGNSDQNRNGAVFGKDENSGSYVVVLTPDFFRKGDPSASQYALGFALSCIAMGIFDDKKLAAQLPVVSDRLDRYHTSGGVYKLHPPLRRMAQCIRKFRVQADRRAMALFPAPAVGLAAMQAMLEANGTAVPPHDEPKLPTTYRADLRPAARLRVARAAL